MWNFHPHQNDAPELVPGSTYNKRWHRQGRDVRCRPGQTVTEIFRKKKTRSSNYSITTFWRVSLARRNDRTRHLVLSFAGMIRVESRDTACSNFLSSKFNHWANARIQKSAGGCYNTYQDRDVSGLRIRFRRPSELSSHQLVLSWLEGKRKKHDGLMTNKMFDHRSLQPIVPTCHPLAIVLMLLAIDGIHEMPHLCLS